MGHNNLLHNPIKCLDRSHSEDNQLYFMYRSEECRLFLEKRAMTAMSAVPEQHEETAGLQTPTTWYEQMQNILTFFVPRLIDENNIVEMQTNYTSYQKIPLHWFHLPNVTKD